MESASRYHPALFWLAVATSVVAFILIGSGGTVTSTGAGMADETWSLSFLYLLTSKVIEIKKENMALFIEHSHRLLGAVVGLMAIALAFLCYRSEQSRRRWIGIGVLLAVILQGVLGAVRVVLNNNQGWLNSLLGRDYAMIHGYFGQITFAFLIGCTLCFSQRWIERIQWKSPLAEDFQNNSKLLTILFLVQLLLAVLVRHKGGGLLIIFHASVAGLILLYVAWLLGRSARLESSLVQQTVWALGLEVLLMILLGTSAWWFGAGYGALEENNSEIMQRITMATLHQWLGALTLATSVVFAMRTQRHLVPATEAASLNMGAA